MDTAGLTGEDAELYKQIVKSTQSPVTSKEQLGQILLKTFHRVADPDTIEYKKVKHLFPKIVKKIVLDDDSGEEVEVEALVGWEEKEIEIPIRKQSEYKELITDDIARAFLSQDDFNLYLDMGTYCETVRSFAKRYDLNLSEHHNHIVNETALMIAGSGAVEGQRPILAKTDIAKSVQGYESMQALQNKPTKREPDLLDEILKRL
ncbi:hypothetical protein LCGC14_0968400 [marine sediment metagenome]|uniref:Uncharacterized protein n=1 Tax=marine sediment metagenome TaxID=412755 RepID=A0A0F9NCG1_9ZZZZ